MCCVCMVGFIKIQYFSQNEFLYELGKNAENLAVLSLKTK